MVFEIVILSFVGLLLFFLAWQVWKKERIWLVSSISRDNVREEDRKPFCSMIGRGLTVMGAGTFLPIAGLLIPRLRTASHILFGAVYAAGIGLLIAAVFRYNKKKAD